MMKPCLLLSASLLWFVTAKPPADDKIGTARWILSKRKWGVLTTKYADLSGTAFGNPIPVADKDGVPYFDVSMMGTTLTQDVQKNPNVSLSLGEAPLRNGFDLMNPRFARLFLSGTIIRVTSQVELDGAKELLFKRHYYMEYWPGDRLIYKLKIQDIWLESKFGFTEALSLEEYKKATEPGGCIKDCSNCTGPFYNTNPDGSCGERTTKKALFMFDASCSLCPECTIRDAETCWSIAENTHEKNDDFLGVYDAVWKDSDGCHVEARDIWAMGSTRIEGNACFGMVQAKYAIPSQLLAVIIGIIFGLVGGCKQCFCRIVKEDARQADEGQIETVNADEGQKSCLNTMDEYFDKDEWNKDDFDRKNFEPGCRLVARDKLLKSGQGFYVVLYRFFEVIAQVWVPAVLLWWYSFFVWVLLILLFYYLPAPFMKKDVITEPQYLVTPGGGGLLGIREGQKRGLHLFFAFRPVLLSFSCYLLAYGLLHYFGEKHFGLALNARSIFNLAFQNIQGDVLVCIIYWVAFVGTALYIVMTLIHLWFLCSNSDSWILFGKNSELADQFEESVDRHLNRVEKEDKLGREAKMKVRYDNFPQGKEVDVVRFGKNGGMATVRTKEGLQGDVPEQKLKMKWANLADEHPGVQVLTCLDTCQLFQSEEAFREWAKANADTDEESDYNEEHPSYKKVDATPGAIANGSSDSPSDAVVASVAVAANASRDAALVRGASDNIVQKGQTVIVAGLSSNVQVGGSSMCPCGNEVRSIVVVTENGPAGKKWAQLDKFDFNQEPESSENLVRKLFSLCSLENKYKAILTSFQCFGAVQDLLIKTYTVYQLLDGARYVMAGAITLFVSASLTLTIVWVRHILINCKTFDYIEGAFKATERTGIYTKRFDSILAWSQKSAIPSLFVYVHALPLAKPTTLNIIISLYSMVAATRTIAVFLFDSEDAGMYDHCKESQRIIKDEPTDPNQADEDSDSEEDSFYPPLLECCEAGS